MVTPHRVHYDLYSGEQLLVDPGDGGTIRTSQDLMICEMVSTTGETRTLEAPTKPGIRLILRMLTDGGDIAVYSAEGFNQAQTSLHVTFADVGDMVSLISVTTATGFRWEMEDGTVGSVALA